ncbi:hypothetical protein PRUPE_3G138300 [Prunus persica]|uniref:DYW domain-containing protein n=1 Tax=Prunus persica TaxID=3760 RepID=M5W016_PRUPE|nr:hypothetical protein PRUPE_3G138300 [Prunus persica]
MLICFFLGAFSPRKATIICILLLCLYALRVWLANHVYAKAGRWDVAFGLLNNPPRTSIRVVNNLQICRDCHSAMKLISQAYNREIVIRDNYRFHRFVDGNCSCKDYW